MNTTEHAQHERGDDERLLTADQVAERLQVSVSTVRRLKQSGALSYIRLGRSRSRNVSVRYRQQDVDDFIARCRHTNSQHASTASSLA